MTQPASNLRLVPKSKDDGDIPPHDETAEAAVLSAAMLDPTAIPKVVDFLEPAHFFSERHRRIFEACVDLWRRREPVDPATVGSWLNACGRLAQVGGAAYLIEVADASPSVANVRSHAVAVHDAWRRRSVIATCQRIIATGYHDVPNVQEFCERAVKAINRFALKNPVRAVETNEQALARILADAKSARAERVDPYAPTLSGFPTGIHGLDRILGGLCKGSKTTVAATTGGGKSAFGVQIAMHLAKQGVGVLYFSTEMKRAELLLRALANEAQVDGVRIRRHDLAPHHLQALVDATDRLNALPWRIDETARLSIEDLAAMARTAAEQFLVQERVPLGMIVLDHVHRLEPSSSVRHKDTHEQLAHASKSFKILCQELDVVGLELAQAKAPLPGKKRVKPRAESGIAETSKIAKESDDVLFLWAEDDPQDDPRQEVSIVVAKQRAGAKGDAKVMFRRDIYRFIDPNTPNPAGSNPSRQYVDDNPLTDGL